MNTTMKAETDNTVSDNVERETTSEEFNNSSDNAANQWKATTVLACLVHNFHKRYWFQSLCLCYTATYGPYFMTASVFSSLAVILGDTTNAAWIPPAYTVIPMIYLC